MYNAINVPSTYLIFHIFIVKNNQEENYLKSIVFGRRFTKITSQSISNIFLNIVSRHK